MSSKFLLCYIGDEGERESLVGAKSPFSTIAGGKRERCFACVITANLQRAAMHIHSVSAAACEILSASLSLGPLFCRREAEAAQIN
jgi:hypothetical protein